MTQHFTGQNEPGTIRFSQTGTFSIAVLLPLLIFFLVMTFVSFPRGNLMQTPFGFLALIFMICLLIFFRITIMVDDEKVSFRMGIGLVRKTFRLETISACVPVVNSAFTGVGIRLLRNGWLYNVSGLKAVELRFRGSNRVVRIGTDNPEGVAAEINRRLNVTAGTETLQPVHRTWYLVSVLIIMLLFVPVLLIITGSRPSKVKLSDKDLTINGMYGMTINFSNILKVDTVASLPRIRVRTNGFASGNVLKGNFRLDDKHKAKLFVNKKKHPFLRIETPETVIYLNRETREETINLYDQIKAGKEKLQ